MSVKFWQVRALIKSLCEHIGKVHVMPVIIFMYLQMHLYLWNMCQLYSYLWDTFVSAMGFCIWVTYACVRYICICQILLYLYQLCVSGCHLNLSLFLNCLSFACYCFSLCTWLPFSCHTTTTRATLTSVASSCKLRTSHKNTCCTSI